MAGLGDLRVVVGVRVMLPLQQNHQRQHHFLLPTGIRLLPIAAALPRGRPNNNLPLLHPLSNFKGGSSHILSGGLYVPEPNLITSCMPLPTCSVRDRSCSCSASRDDKLVMEAVNQEVEGLVLNAVGMNLVERLQLAWRILFPTTAARTNSNAKIAKQRLKMILFSDRCAVSDEARQKIVSNIIAALSDFVEIDSQDKVQLSVSADPNLGTLYSVVVPVRRVKPEHQDFDKSYRGITNIEYLDTQGQPGMVDVRFDFSVDKP